MKTKNKNTTRNIMVAGIAMFFIFISANTFAQSTVKQADTTNNTSVIPAKDIEIGSTNIYSTSKTNITPDNKPVKTVPMRAIPSKRIKIYKPAIAKQNDNDTLNLPKDKTNENVTPNQ